MGRDLGRAAAELCLRTGTTHPGAPSAAARSEAGLSALQALPRVCAKHRQSRSNFPLMFAFSGSSAAIFFFFSSFLLLKAKNKNALRPLLPPSFLSRHLFLEDLVPPLRLSALGFDKCLFLLARFSVRGGLSAAGRGAQASPLQSLSPSGCTRASLLAGGGFGIFQAPVGRMGRPAAPSPLVSLLRKAGAAQLP